MRPSLWKSRGYVATPYCFHMVLRTFTRETPATHVQLSRASSNHVIERRPSSVYRYSQSFSTVKRKQITMPCVEPQSHDRSYCVQSFPWICMARPCISPTNYAEIAVSVTITKHVTASHYGQTQTSLVMPVLASKTHDSASHAKIVRH